MPEDNNVADQPVRDATTGEPVENQVAADAAAQDDPADAPAEEQNPLAEPVTGQANSPLTPGQTAVGLAFNPSGNPKVAALKDLFAQAFDIVEGSTASRDEQPTLANDRKRKMRDAALHEIVTAQMWAVKVVTLEA